MRIWLLTTLFVLLLSKGYSQSCSNPTLVDLSAQANMSVTQSGSRNGTCCGGSNCIVFLVKINPGTNLLTFSPGQVTGSGNYTVDCGPLIPTGTPVCITGKTSVTISFCKPGGNGVTYTITASSGIQTSPNLALRQGCAGIMSVAGLVQSSVTWTSISPGAAGAYNSYLSSTSGVDSVSVTPPISAPPYVDYQVSGNPSTTCSTTNSGTIRVYMFPQLTVSINPSSPAICSGTPVTLTANPSGGDPAYTYLWNTGATTASITTSTTGTYTVSVNDQSSCVAVTQQVTVTAFTPVAPTAPPVSICTGSTATLTATAPGGPYQWYDAAVGGNLLATTASYTTPVLTANTTYYVQTTNGGCTSSRTAVTVTVNPLPPTPGILSH